MISQKRNVVVDTTFLDAVYRLQIFDKLVFLYSKVFIPVEVEREFLSDKNRDRDSRFSFLLSSFSRYSWLVKCNSFDEMIIKLLSAEPDIHRGESEVIAQVRELGMKTYSESSLSAVIDDQRARVVASRMEVDIVGTLKILALFHFNGFLDYHKSVNKLRRAGVRYRNDVVQLAFDKTESEFKSGVISFSDNVD